MSEETRAPFGRAEHSFSITEENATRTQQAVDADRAAAEEAREANRTAGVAHIPTETLRSTPSGLESVEGVRVQMPDPNAVSIGDLTFHKREATLAGYIDAETGELTERGREIALARGGKVGPTPPAETPRQPEAPPETPTEAPIPAAVEAAETTLRDLNETDRGLVARGMAEMINDGGVSEETIEQMAEAREISTEQATKAAETVAEGFFYEAAEAARAVGIADADLDAFGEYVLAQPDGQKAVEGHVTRGDMSGYQQFVREFKHARSTLTDELLDKYVGEHELSDSDQIAVVWKEDGDYWVHHARFGGAVSLRTALLTGELKGKHDAESR